MGAPVRAAPEKTGLFDLSLKQHYHRNRRAVNNIGLSFLFFYVTGQVYLSKVGSSSSSNAAATTPAR